jgi:hypothetical protein
MRKPMRKHRLRKKSLEEKAEMLVGSSTWHTLNRVEKADVISEMLTEGLLMATMPIMARGGVTADSLKVKYTLSNNEVVVVDYDSKEAMDDGIADFYLTNDVEAVEIVESKKEEKKGLFDMAKKAPVKKSASKEKPEVIVEGIESEIARYDALKEIINNAKAEQEVIGGKLKQIGKEEFLALYEETNRKPDNFNLADGDEKILFIVMDKYKKVEPEKEALLEQYDGLLEKVTTYSFNPEVLDRVGEQVSDLILNSDLSEADKKNLLIVETTTTIRKGSIDRLTDYEDPEEIFNLIEPILALK